MKALFTHALSLIILLLLADTVLSQVNWDTLPWKNYADYRLQPLNKSYVATGILYGSMLPVTHDVDYTGRLFFGAFY